MKPFDDICQAIHLSIKNGTLHGGVEVVSDVDATMDIHLWDVLIEIRHDPLMDKDEIDEYASATIEEIENDDDIVENAPVIVEVEDEDMDLGSQLVVYQPRTSSY